MCVQIHYTRCALPKLLLTDSILRPRLLLTTNSRRRQNLTAHFTAAAADSMEFGWTTMWNDGCQSLTTHHIYVFLTKNKYISIILSALRKHSHLSHRCRRRRRLRRRHRQRCCSCYVLDFSIFNDATLRHDNAATDKRNRRIKEKKYEVNRIGTRNCFNNKNVGAISFQ